MPVLDDPVQPLHTPSPVPVEPEAPPNPVLPPSPAPSLAWFERPEKAPMRGAR
jgi:hypothetical protein